MVLYNSTDNIFYVSPKIYSEWLKWKLKIDKFEQDLNNILEIK